MDDTFTVSELALAGELGLDLTDLLDAPPDAEPEPVELPEEATT